LSSLAQLITSDEMRGRVMSVYDVAFLGGMLIPIFSAPVVLAANGVLLVLISCSCTGRSPLFSGLC